eukprot:gene7761-8976_t
MVQQLWLLCLYCTTIVSGLPRGLLDVTQPPYSADNTGKHDVTSILQQAITDGYSKQLAVYFPVGKYLVSDTLTVLQSGWGAEQSDGGVNIVPCRFHSNTLIGSTEGLKLDGSGQRPTIVLAPTSPGFNNENTPKNVMKITNSHAENINMNNVFRGIDFEISHGNPGAVGLFFHGAQGGVTQDVTVTFPFEGYAGFGGGGGAGASHINVKVVGGRYGLWFKASEPCPVAAGVTLINQTSSAVMYGGQQTLVLAGLHVEMAAGAVGPAVAPASKNQPITLVDATIDCSNGNGSIVPIQLGVASIYLRNVFISSRCNLESVGYPTTTAAGQVVARESRQWLHVVELARGVDAGSNGGDTVIMDVIYKNGVRTPNATVYNASLVQPGMVTPGDAMVAKHTWDEGTFATLERAADAVADCGAKGDGVADDTDALQACVDTHRDVFLPKGRFRLSKTLEVGINTTLLGLSQTLSVLMPMHDGFRTDVDQNAINDNGVITTTRNDTSRNEIKQPPSCNVIDIGINCDGDNVLPVDKTSCVPRHDLDSVSGGIGPLPPSPSPPPVPPSPPSPPAPSPPPYAFQPLVRTAAGGPVTIAFIGMVSWWHLPIYTLDYNSVDGLWRSNYETRVSECLWLNDYHSQTTVPPCVQSFNLTVPKTQIKGTGKFYNFVNDEDILFTDHKGYRHIVVDGVDDGGDDSVSTAGRESNKGRVVFYMLNMEHAQAETNMEISNSSRVDIFGLKVEGSVPVLWVSDSDDIRLFGMGGGADAFPDTSYYPADMRPYAPSMLRIERTTNFKLINLFDGGRGKDGKPVTPIGSFPLTPDILKAYDFYQADIQAIIHGMWSPWPGYKVGPSEWHLIWEGESMGQGDVSKPLDRPVLYGRD